MFIAAITSRNNADQCANDAADAVNDRSVPETPWPSRRSRSKQHDDR